MPSNEELTQQIKTIASALMKAHAEEALTALADVCRRITELTSQKARADRLAESVRNVRPSCRGSLCWCELGWNTDAAHSQACLDARAALAQREAGAEPVDTPVTEGE